MTKVRAIIYSHALPAVFALFVGYVAILAWDRSTPSTILWGKVVPPIVESGHDVTFHYGEVKHAEYGGVVHRKVVDSRGVTFFISDTPTVNDQITKLEVEQEVIKDFPVPYGMSAGLASYISDSRLYKKANFVQWLFPVQSVYTYPFEVKREHGEQGVQGKQGIQGEPGESIKGQQGVQGIQGEPGKNAK